MSDTIKKIIRYILKIFYVFPVDNRRIFLMSFNGSAYGYDSKAMAEYIESNYNGLFQMIWGTKSNRYFKNIDIDNLRFVRLKSIKGIYYMMTSGTLIYNINPPSYIPFRENKQILINTWHGMPYKKVGRYAKEFNEKQVNTTTHFLSHCEKYTQWVIRDSLLYNNKVINCGVPRNDIFFSPDKVEECRRKVKEHYLIDADCKTILYAPTFRGDFLYESTNLNFKLMRAAVKKRFGGEWIILFRIHPMVVNKYAHQQEVIDVSAHPDMQELLCCADILITDFSSCMWDFSLTQKPVFVFADDVDSYETSRGLYMPCRKWPFPVARNNEELQKEILEFNENVYRQKINAYTQYMNSYETGDAARQIMELICKRL